MHPQSEIAYQAELATLHLRLHHAETRALLSDMRAAHLERQLKDFQSRHNVELPKDTWRKRK